ncbi:Nucleoporin p58/p45 [Mactra antiquata]
MATSGFNFGASKTPATTRSVSFGTPAASTGSLSLNLGQTSTPGFGFGATTTPSVGFGATASATAVMPKPAGLPGLTGTSSTPSFSFSKPIAATTSTGGFGFGGDLKLSTATTTSSTGLVGLGFNANTTATAATGSSIFGQSVAKTTASGLGGVDPKTTTSTAVSDTGKPGDGKAVKEMAVENNILLDVDELSKFVKEEKSEMEQMKRLSSTPMVKVQEDNAALKQLLSVVSSALQRNTCAVDKLKKEMTQELKNAEMAVRTKETPAGLQYENTAPTQYFQSVIEHFETQMVTYRQQIEMLENHLASVHQPNRLTHEELILLLRKLHEAFIAMAAQLQQIHEAVKTQKDHYLNYRKVFHGDNRNIFERQRKAPVKVSSKANTDIYGQSPFPGINDSAAVAMASALTRTQQPQGASGAPPVTGFINFQQPTGFGAASTGFGTGTSAFGTGGFGTGTFGTATGGFGTGTNSFGAGTASFGTGTSGFGTGAFGAGVIPRPALSTATEQPFLLGRPPGSKRNKK